MSDQTAPADAEQTAPEAGSAAEDDRRVPYDRFEKVNKDARDAKKRLAELERQLEERESAGLPELERERKAREKAEQRLTEYEQRIEQFERETTQLRKQDWVKEAAREANFHNPGAAARLLDLDGVESQEDAARAVKRLAKADGWLVKPTEPERPQIGQVFGRDAGGNGDRQQGPVPGDVNDPTFKREMGRDMLKVLRGEQ